MQRATKAELQMLRELGWLILPRLECFFCHSPIMGGPQGAMTFGHRRHPAIETKFTVHHEDKDRENNQIVGLEHIMIMGLHQLKGNLKISHKRCHQQFHANERRTNDNDNDDTSDS